MKKINRALTLIMALLFVLNTSVVFAAKDDSPSYQSGYDAGLSESDNYSGADGDDEKAYLKFIRTKEFDDLVDGIDDFDLDDFEEGFYEGFEDGLREVTVYDYPKELGKALGNIYGARDFQNGAKFNWEKALPSDREIRSIFNLNTHDSDYREFFTDTFKLAFKDEYILSYDNAQFEPFRVTFAQGIADGEELGGLLGATFGYKDYYENRKLDFTRNLPSDRVITTEYSLNNDSDEYKDGFLSGFVRAYEEAYNEAYREANINDTLRDEKDAIAHGHEIGVIAGSTQATLDFMSKLTNDWRRSLPSEKFIILEYSLTSQSPNYRDGFLAGFFDGYSEGYNLRFKELSQGLGVDKSISEIIPLAGGILNSLDNAMNITIKPGTYYHPVNLTINTTYDVGNMVVSSLVKTSDSYRVSILNTSGNLNNEKSIEMAFEYYGDRLKGGIYKLANGFWTYVPSVVQENRIVANIAPNTISATGNVYAVFVDTGAKYFADSRGHWAKDEIETLVRRNIIYGYPDGTFKPNRNVTRAEFLWLLSRMNRWNLPYYPVNEKLFTDFNNFGASAEVINYAFAEGYINGYPDGTFRPNNNISYTEIQTIMGRVTGKSDFKWTDIATKMLYEEKVRSTSFANMNNKITRAEIVYMLYNITESRY